MITLVNPPGLPEIDLYRQVSVATGSRLVFVAGQVARGGDLAAQTEECYLAIATALTEVGATFADVAKLTVYLVDWTPEKMPMFLKGRDRAATRLGLPLNPPLTGIGVAALAEPHHLVEIEATAVLD